MRVQVYFNLHKKCFSIKRRGYPVEHVDEIDLIGVEFRVQPKGRQRVLDTCKKNVHAFVVGERVDQLWSLGEEIDYDPVEIGYYPYLYGDFIYRRNGKPIKVAEKVSMFMTIAPIPRPVVVVWEKVDRECQECSNTGFSSVGTGYDAVCACCGGQSAVVSTYKMAETEITSIPGYSTQESLGC